jgi:beta-glucosidase/6-phospho-beta-glucosidase/beta-galactosidase
MDRFWWGTAIENTWLTDQSGRRRTLDEFEETQHYRFLQQDLDLASGLGVNMIRYSAPWYRMNPAPGKFDWAWLDEALNYCVGAKHLEVFFDLVHYGTPLWLDNGYINHGYPERVAEYAAAVADRYKDKVRFYTPFNEPFIAIFRSGQAGVWPPFLRGDDGFVKVLEGVCRGIVQSVRAIRSVSPDARIVTVNNTGPVSDGEGEKRLGDRPLLRDLMLVVEDLIAGKVTHEHPLRAYLLRAGMCERTLEWFQRQAIQPDIVGVNYYPMRWYDRSPSDPEAAYHTARYSPSVSSPSELPKEERVRLAAQDLRERLELFARRVNKPLFITETSGGFTEEEKIDWLRESTATVRKLRASGVDIVGYLWWPLFDAVQWEFCEGRRPAQAYIWPGRWNNGLYRLENTFDGTLRRVPTRAAEAYRALIGSGERP